MSLCDTRKAMKMGATNVEKRSLKTKHLAPIFRAELSGHVALRHPQSNENGRYERGEALTENKALSAYFQGRTGITDQLLFYRFAGGNSTLGAWRAASGALK